MLLSTKEIYMNIVITQSIEQGETWKSTTTFNWNVKHLTSGQYLI